MDCNAQQAGDATMPGAFSGVSLARDLTLYLDAAREKEAWMSHTSPHALPPPRLQAPILATAQDREQ